MEPFAVYEEILKVAIVAASNRAELFQALQHHPDSPYRDQHQHPVADHIDTIKKNVAEVNSIIETLLGSKLSRKQREQLEKYVEERKTYLNEGLTPVCNAILAGDFHGANEILLNKALPMSVVAINEAESFGSVGAAESSVLNLSIFFALAMVAFAVWLGLQL